MASKRTRTATGGARGALSDAPGRPRADQAIFVDQPADASLFPEAVLAEIDRPGQRLHGRGCVQGAVRPVLIVWVSYWAQDLPQMGLVPGQGGVRGSRPAFPRIRRSAMVFTRGVWTLHSMVRMPASARTASNGAVKFGAAVADHELGPVRLVAEVHEQVTGLLGGPWARWMLGDAEDADAPGRVLDHGQDVGPGAVEQGRG